MLSLCALAAPLAASAQDNKRLEWVVGYAAIGGSDIVARAVGGAMSQSLKQTIVINEKPGAATNIAPDDVAKATDTTYTLLMADFATLATNASLFAKLHATRSRTSLRSA